jgi:hypothetical protein
MPEAFLLICGINLQASGTSATAGTAPRELG